MTDQTNPLPEDPGLPMTLLDAIEAIFVADRASGTLIVGLGGPPVFLSQVRQAIQVRFGPLSEVALDQAVTLVHRAVPRARLVDAGPRYPRWVDAWAPFKVITWR